MIPLEIPQIAHLAAEALKNHWEVATAPFGDAMLSEAGKSIYALLKQRFAGSAADNVMEEAAADPTDQDKSVALVKQIGTAMEADGSLVSAIRDLLRSLPPQSLMKVTQSGDKNVSVQNLGASNKTSIQIS
jgi:hypothetical protein